MEAENPHSAVFLDGTSNRKRRVTLLFSDQLDIAEDGTMIARWSYDQVRRADGPEDMLRLSCAEALPLARLEIRDSATMAAVLARCPTLDAGGPAKGQAGRIVLWSLAAVASIFGLTYFGIPFAADRLAPLVPMRMEKRIGDAVDTQARAIFGGRTCDHPAGKAALATLVGKLKRAGRIDFDIEAAVMSSRIPNAFALPGGKIFLLDGLLQRARNVDEVAGVMAHELGHVQHRDHLRKIIQNGGTSFLVGLLFGDVTGSSAVIFAGRSLFDASYSREAERDADRFAIDVMHELGRSPKPMGEFLFRITGAQTEMPLSILATHPLTADRRALMTQEDRPVSGVDLLSADEWQALRRICETRPSLPPTPRQDDKREGKN